MKLIFLIILSFFFSYSEAQVLLLTNAKKHSLIKRVEKSFKKYNRTYTKAETDSSLSYTTIDTLYRPATFIYYFGVDKRCIKQDMILDCDSCLKLIMKRQLKNPFERWKIMKDGRYYAPFPYYVVMEAIFSENKYIIRFTKTKRSDIDYLLQ